MRKNASVVFLVLAWLCANGAIRDAVQVFAWGRMFAGYTETMSVGAALKATLDPERPCPICLTVAGARETEQKNLPQGLTVEKIVLLCEGSVDAVILRAPDGWPLQTTGFPPGRTEPVPLRPPRV